MNESLVLLIQLLGGYTPSTLSVLLQRIADANQLRRCVKDTYRFLNPFKNTIQADTAKLQPLWDLMSAPVPYEMTEDMLRIIFLAEGVRTPKRDAAVEAKYLSAEVLLPVMELTQTSMGGIFDLGSTKVSASKLMGMIDMQLDYMQEARTLGIVIPGQDALTRMYVRYLNVYNYQP